MKFLEILDKVEQIRKFSQIIPAKDREKMRSEALKKMEERESIGQEKALEVWGALVARVREEHGDIYEEFLKKIAVGYGLAHLMTNPPALDAPLPGGNTLYQQVLPLCELANLYEQNGDAEEHAAKIAMIFNDEPAVFVWLLKYGKKIKDSGYPVHDACLFDLPKPEDCTFSHWKKLANEGDNMLTPGFRKLLPHAQAIEAVVASEAMFKPENSPKPDSKSIEAAERAVRLATSNYRKKKRESSDTLSPAEKLTRIEELKDLAIKKFEANVALAQVCRGIPVSKLSVLKLQAYYELYKANSNKSHKILIDNGISEKDIAVFYALEHRNDDQAIPNVFINGEEIGYPGVYLKKLDILSEQGAAIAACLGKMPKMNCCQYLGGAGSSCVEYGISSPNGGFYVLCKGNAKEPKIDDEILAQAWTWSSQSGALCLDSIETKHKDKLNTITDMYRYFSHTLCHNPIQGQRPITHINVGAQSGVSKKVALKDYPAPREYFIDYAGYTDAKSQQMLANSSMPYLFYGQVKSAAFLDMIEKQSEDFFSAIFQNQNPLKNNEPLKQAIAFALYSNNNKLLTLLKVSAGERHDELQSLISVNRRYVENLDKNKIDFDALENGAYLNAMSKKGENALHLAALAGNETDVCQLIKSGINLNIQDKYGNSALMIVLEVVLYKNKKEQGRVLAQVLIEAGANIDIQDKYEKTPLIIAVKNSDITMVRYLVDDYKADIETFDGDMKTAIFWAVEKGAVDIFNYLLHKNANLNLVSDNNKDSLLMAAVWGGNQEIIKALLSRKGVNIGHKNKDDQTVLHLAAKNPESLKVLLELIPEEQRLDAVKVVDNNGRTVLHLATRNPESLTAILALISEEQGLDAVKVADKYGRTVLHLAAGNPELLKVLLALIPEKQKLDAVKMADKFGNTVLHLAASNPESLKTILALYPEEQRPVAVKVADKYGRTVLHLAAGNPESLKIIDALTSPQKPVSPDAFFQPASSLENPPTAENSAAPKVP